MAVGTGLGVALILEGRVERERAAKERVLAEITRARDENAQAVLSEYQRLGDLLRLWRLVAEADTLWPAEPSKILAMKTWVEQGDVLWERLAGHKEELDRLRLAALPPQAQEARRIWRFNDPAGQARHDAMAKLVADLTAFVDPNPANGLLSRVKARLDFAETVKQETIDKYEKEWANAVRSIADQTDCPKYRGLKIVPQVGLIPIGKDAASGLWEFSDLQTTEPGTSPIPMRFSDGRLFPGESTGLVFVLIPGGSFTMGAIRPMDGKALTDPNVDPLAEEDESPITNVTLGPFFLSKYEMTQGQWLRLDGTNPSAFPDRQAGIQEHSLLHPVEQVSWDDSDLWLARLGLMLPTEAQWEYAARGGTTTPWWTGTEKGGLARAANVADQACRRGGFPADWKYEEWDDGYSEHATIGCFAPNPFGLHDVLGNVDEWCRDWYGSYQNPTDPGDGLRHPADADERVVRGGAFESSAARCRSAARGRAHHSVEWGPNSGIRPARLLVPAAVPVQPR